jgi:chromosomal replication initiator protein
VPGVEDRLRERFECGLVADIRPPDHATRVAILRKRAALDGIELADPAVLDLIAKRITQNVRLLEGALIRVVASHSLTGRPINVELARSVLDGMGQGAKNSAPTFAEIQAAVASQYEVTVSDLISSGRAARIAWPRQVAIYLTRELTSEPLHAIGEAFGGRNHATVLHACKRVSDRLVGDHDAGADLNDLKATLVDNQDDRGC